MTTVAYCRVSTDAQDLSRQLDLLKPFNPAKIYKDEGHSRDDEDRPEFQQMIKDAKAGKFDTILVTEQDRFGTGDSHELGYYTHILRKAKVKLMTIAGKVITAKDPGSVFNAVIGSVTSRQEQETKGIRSASARIRDAKLFKFCGGRVSPCMDIVAFAGGVERYRVQVSEGKYTRIRGDVRETFDKPPAKDPDVDLFVRPGENTWLIIEIFKRYADRGQSPLSIAQWVSENKFPGWARLPVHKNTIYDVLRNPLYIGKPIANVRRGARFAEFSGGRIQEPGEGPLKPASDWIQPSEPLFECVPLDLWERTQLRIKQRSGKTTIARDGSDDLWLRPLLFCAGCGRRMRASRGARRIPGYACSEYLDGTRRTDCRHYHVRHDELMVHVREWLRQSQAKLGQFRPVDVAFDKFMQAVAITDKMAALAGNENYSTFIERQMSEVGDSLRVKESELDKAIAAYATLPKTLQERAKANLVRLEKEIDELRERTTDLRKPLEKVYDEYQAIEKAVEEANDELSIETLRKLVSHIIVHHENIGAKRSVLKRVEFVVLGSENSPGRALRIQHFIPREVVCA